MSLKLGPSDYVIYIPICEWIESNIKEWLFEQRPLFKKISAPIDTVLGVPVYPVIHIDTRQKIFVSLDDINSVSVEDALGEL